LNRLGFDAASFLVKDEAMSKRYPIEQRERAVKMVLDHLHEYNSLYAACQAIGGQVPGRGVRRRRVILRGDGSGGQGRRHVLLFGR
jgi:hypothetical protein